MRTFVTLMVPQTGGLVRSFTTEEGDTLATALLASQMSGASIIVNGEELEVNAYTAHIRTEGSMIAQLDLQVSCHRR